jgi:hypothetical protein
MVVVAVVVVTAPQGKDPRRSGQVGLGSGHAQVRCTRCLSFSENGSQRVLLSTNSVLAEPSLPLRQSATNSLRVGAENLTMADLLMVCDGRGSRAQGGAMCDGIIPLKLLTSRAPCRLCCDDEVPDNK